MSEKSLASNLLFEDYTVTHSVSGYGDMICLTRDGLVAYLTKVHASKTFKKEKEYPLKKISFNKMLQIATREYAG